MAEAGPILIWAAVTAFGVIAFLGFAVFCAMLTGNLLLLPLAWLLIGCAAVAAEYCLRHLMAYFVYGMAVRRESLGVLSPLCRVVEGLSVSSVFDEAGLAIPDAYRLNDVGLMAIYAGCGLVLAMLALLLFRRRALERAGDAVAFDTLKPLFRFCMAVGCAIVLPAAVFDWRSHKARHEHAQRGTAISSSPTRLRDGSTLLRNYRLAVTRDAMLDPDSDFRRMSALFNCREAILERTLGDFPYEDMLIAGGAISWQTEGGIASVPLSDEARKGLFRGSPAGSGGQTDRPTVFLYQTPEQYTTRRTSRSDSRHAA